MTDHGPTLIDYRQTDQFQLTRSFLDDPERFFHHLLGDHD
jgi:predicted ATPase